MSLPGLSSHLGTGTPGRGRLASVKTQTVTSAGGVVRDASGKVLMIARRSPAGKIQWTLPKGLVEKGEDPEATAVREVEEETGFEAEITGPATTIDYWFVWKPEDTRYHKFVRYYPMQATQREPGEPDGEAETVEWVEPEEAVQRASFGNERAILEEMLGVSARRTGTERKPRASAPRTRAAK